MKPLKLLLATACVLTLITPGHANFTMRGIMHSLMTGEQTPTCGQFTKWWKTYPNDRGVMGQWILGFYSGIESQLTDGSKYAKATGSEQSNEAILGVTLGFCTNYPKQQVLAAVWMAVKYGLEQSVKHPNPRYQHGFNVHGVLGQSTCQNFIVETGGEWESNGFTMKNSSSDRKFLLEEWILGAASGIEAHALRGKREVTKVSNDELLESIYTTCRGNPTAYVFQVVLDQELLNIEAMKPDPSVARKYGRYGTTSTGKNVACLSG